MRVRWRASRAVHFATGLLSVPAFAPDQVTLVQLLALAEWPALLAAALEPKSRYCATPRGSSLAQTRDILRLAWVAQSLGTPHSDGETVTTSTAVVQVTPRKKLSRKVSPIRHSSSAARHPGPFLACLPPSPFRPRLYLRVFFLFPSSSLQKSILKPKPNSSRRAASSLHCSFLLIVWIVPPSSFGFLLPYLPSVQPAPPY